MGFEKNPQFNNPTYLDIDPDTNPDVVWDLNKHPLPFKDNEFDEIHAYDILEHLASQGDYKFFFSEWNEYYRILKPNGVFCGTVPDINSTWVWGDPGHTRLISLNLLGFLDKELCENDIKKGSARTDYSELCKANFKYEQGKVEGDTWIFVLRKG